MISFTILIKASASKERRRSSGLEFQGLIECVTSPFIDMLVGNPRFLISMIFRFG